MAARVRQSQHPEKSVGSFSYGFWEDQRNGQRVIHHAGSMLGYEGELLLVPDHRIGLYVIYNRDDEAGGGSPRLGPTLRSRLLAHWFPDTGMPALADALPIDTGPFAGAYAPGTYCHTCYEGEGWAFSYLAVRSAGPGLLDVGGQRWRAIDSLLFVNERDPRQRIAFTKVGGRVAYLAQAGFGTMRERLDDRLLDEALGTGWREQPAHPLAARVYYATEQWDLCTQAYLAIAARRPEDGHAGFYGGRCARGAGRLDEAVTLLARAWDRNNFRNLAAYHLGAVYARRNEPDSAFVWLKRAVELRHPRLQVLDTDPDLASIRSDPRFASLRVARP